MSKEADYDVTVRISELRHTDQTIRRLRALADGYKWRAYVNGQVAQLRCETCTETSAAEERARIVARLREEADTAVQRIAPSDPREAEDCETSAATLRDAADIIESEEP